MASTKLERLRAEKKAQAEAAAIDPETIDPSMLDAQLEASREAANAARSIAELVSKIERQIAENRDAIEDAKEAVAAAALAGKPLPNVPADMSEPLNAALTQARTKLVELEAAATRADALLKQAEAAVAAKAEAGKCSALAAELEPVLAQLRDKLVASGVSGVVEVAGVKIELKRAEPVAARNVHDDDELDAHVRWERKQRGAISRLVYVPGRAGTVDVTISFSAVTQPAPDAPDVLDAKQCAELNAQALAAAEAKRAAERADAALKASKAFTKMEVPLTSGVGRVPV